MPSPRDAPSNPSRGVLAKTAKGLHAARDGNGLSAHAAALLRAIDGRSDLATLGQKDRGMRVDQLAAAVKELLSGGYVQPLGMPAPLPPKDAAGDRPESLITLDFTRVRATQKLRQAAALAKMREEQRADDERRSAEADAGLAAAGRARAEQEARDAQAKLEADARGMLVKVLRPRVEEALRAKLTAALKPKIEAELREKIAAALRPALEAALRPKIELELRARFARQLADAAAPRNPVQSAPMDDSAARLLASLGEAVFETDLLGVLTRVNPAWTQLSGRDEDASVGKALADFFADSDRRAVEEFLGRIAQGTAIRFVHEAALERATGESGEAAWVELRAAPLVLVSGEAAGVCGVLHEAGEAKRAAAELEDASLRLLLLVDESDAGVLIEDAEGAIRQVNPAFCSLFGVQAAPFSFEGAAVAGLIEEIAPVLADADLLLARMAAIRAGAEDVDGETLALRGGGAATISYRAVAEDGPPRGHLWIFRLTPAAVSMENPA